MYFSLGINVPIEFISYCVAAETYYQNCRQIGICHAHTEPIFRKLKIFPFDKIYSFHLGKFMYLYYKEMLPPSFNNFFLCVKQVHNYNTRNSNLLFVPFCRTKIRQFSVIYQGVKLFNSLPRDIYGASSISCFRKSLKEYLFTL